MSKQLIDKILDIEEHVLEMGDGSAMDVSPIGKARLRYNEGTAQIEVSVEGGDYAAIGAGEGGGGSVAAGAGLTGGGPLPNTVNVTANADGSIVVNPNDVQVGILATDAQHGARGGGTQHSGATESTAGFMSSADKLKLNYLAADWAIATTRFFMVDFILGDDVNHVGYNDGSPDAAKAIKTLSRLAAIIPRFGAGRTIKVLIRGGATNVSSVVNYAESLDLRYMGYDQIQARGSTDLTDSATDRALQGYIVAVAGPNGDQSFTCGSGSTTSLINVATALTANACRGYRIRFSGNNTVALANQCRDVHTNGTGDITPGSLTSTAAAAGDTFWIEKAGARITGWNVNGAQARRCLLSGLECSAGVTSRPMKGSLYLSGMFFAAGGLTYYSPSDTGGIGGTYIDADGTALAIGVGVRATTGCTLTSSPGSTDVTSALSNIYAMSTTLTFNNFQNQILLGASCYAVGAITFNQCGKNTRDCTIGQGSTGSRRLKSDSTVTILGCSARIQGVDCTKLILGNSTIGAGNHMTVDDIVGTSADFGIDVSNNYGSTILFGKISSNSITGPSGDIKLAGGAVTTHAAMTTVGFIDEQGNALSGTAGLTNGVCQRFTNKTGAAFVIGSVCRSNGTTKQVIAAVADTTGHADGVFCVALTPAADNAEGYFAVGGAPFVKFTGASPTPNTKAYLSDTAGKAGTSAGTIEAFLGYITENNTVDNTLARVGLAPTRPLTNSDGSLIITSSTAIVGVLASDAQHGVRGGGTQHSNVVAAGAAGFMTGADKTKLDGLPSAAVPTSRTVTAGTGLTGGGALSGDITLNVIANADGSIVANGDDIQVGVLATDAQHGTRGGGTQHAVATGGDAGFMSAADKTAHDSLVTRAPLIPYVVASGTTADILADDSEDVYTTEEGIPANETWWMTFKWWDYSGDGGSVTVTDSTRFNEDGTTTWNLHNSGADTVKAKWYLLGVVVS
jgi:hypothetical protein